MKRKNSPCDPVPRPTPVGGLKLPPAGTLGSPLALPVQPSIARLGFTPAGAVVVRFVGSSKDTIRDDWGAATRSNLPAPASVTATVLELPGNRFPNSRSWSDCTLRGRVCTVAVAVTLALAC